MIYNNPNLGEFMKYLFPSLFAAAATLTAVACSPPSQSPSTADDQASSLVCVEVLDLCLPLIPCCGDDVCVHGVCTDLCAGVTCTASDSCHDAGTCDPHTGTCSNPVKADGAACNDSNSCTQTDVCTGGVCSGSSSPCQNGGTCAASGGSFTCTCTGGFTGTTCETPAGPAIGCHDDPANSGNTGVDDLFYSGPIDTINNVTFFRAPRDGTCTGDSFQAGAALISAADATEAATKCQSLTGGSALDASIWDGLAGFWVCLRGGSGGG